MEKDKGNRRCWLDPLTPRIGGGYPKPLDARPKAARSVRSAIRSGALKREPHNASPGRLVVAASLA